MPTIIFLVKRFFLFLFLITFSSCLFAKEVNVPIRLKEGLLQKALMEQVYTDSDYKARVWDDGKNCNNLILSKPTLSIKDEQVATYTVAVARIGTVLGNRCFSLISWQGYIEIFQKPVLGTTSDTIVFEITDTKVYSDDGESKGFVGTIWEWSKTYIKPHFSRLHINIGPLLNDLKNILAQVFPDGNINVQQINDSVAIKEVSIIDDRIELGIRFDVPENTVNAIHNQAVSTLTEDELNRFTEAWQRWDAFLTFVIKFSGATTEIQETRSALFNVLLDARHDIYNILVSTQMDNEDPVPELFVNAWEQLSPELQTISESLPTATTLNYLSFISAADALVAIQSLGTTTGFTITADALRRMARIIAPADPHDPLLYDNTIDTELRSLFGFDQTLSVEPNLSNQSSSNSRIQHAGFVYGLLLSFTTSINFAPEAYKLLVDKLNSTIPTRKNIDFYLPLMKELLIYVADSTMVEKKLDKKYEKIYRDMVLATAWQESCWRQFIKTKDGIKTISSPVGSIGAMQINKHVWRGFYDVESLLNNIGYNTRAGSEILHHYFVDYAIKKGEDKQAGGIDNLPSSSYAMYNGGPKHISRYRNENTSASLRAIDNAFKEKYEAVRAGNTLGVAECYTG